MICNNCKKIIEDDCKHCPFCGIATKKAVSEPNAESDIKKGVTPLELKQRKEADLARKKRQKRIFAIGSACFAFVAVLSVFAYFVFIPLGRNYYYKDLVANGKLDKAIKSYNNSVWFEYDEQVKNLFYESTLGFVEAKDYKTAENYFEMLKDYKDGEKYYNYCKAQNLLSDKDLNAYDCFVKLGDFLDCKKIIETNEYFITVNRLQGEWKCSETSLSDIDNYMLDKGYTIDNKNGVYEKKKDSISSFKVKRAEIHESSIKFDGMTVSGYIDGKLEIASDGKIKINCDGILTRLELNENGTVSLDNITNGMYPFVIWEKSNNID